MAQETEKLLAEELVRRGLLTQAAVDKYLAEIRETKEGLKNYLTSHGVLNEKEVLDVLAAVLHLSTVDLKNTAIDKAVVEKVPVRFAWYFKFMPLKIENKTLTLARSSPLDVKFQDEIRVHLGLEPHVVLAKESDVLDALNKYYGLAADTIDRLSKDTAKKPSWDLGLTDEIEDLERSIDDASVTKIVNEILLEAYKKRSTDIHIEPYRNKVRVRYRIDGVLVDANIPPAVKGFLPSIISRIKIMANLSIVEKRLPQDGSAVVKTKEQDLDLRVSTIPTPWGESMVIRILPTDVMFLNLERLGLDPKNIKLFRQLVKKPHGIILVTGPTGSGKTTTLYACLNEINSPNRKIITLEDPIEYEVEGITQIQINPKINMGFAEGLRSLLRHDPDIIMVGEIRDLETAEISIRTALTGHLVLSTLHTNDAASGVTRLVDMGVQPFLVASSVEAFVAQRLVRVICTFCKEEIKTSLLEIREEMAKALSLHSIDDIKLFRGRGCDHCHHTGFYGRTAIYEVLTMNEDIRAAVLEKRRAEDLKVLAMKNGMTTLRQDGWQKVLNGITTAEEVLNVTAVDEYSEADVKPSSAQAAPVSSQAAVGASLFDRIVSQEVLTAKNEYDSRVYPRLKEKVSIRYALVRQDPQDPRKLVTDKVEHASLTKDVSAGGVRFVSGYSLPVGTILELKIQLEKPGKSIDCLAKVCRVDEEGASTMFNLVVYYLDITSADRVRIDEFVRQRLGKGE